MVLLFSCDINITRITHTLTFLSTITVNKMLSSSGFCWLSSLPCKTCLYGKISKSLTLSYLPSPGLQECSSMIGNYSCDRVPSVSSLASRDSRGNSFTSSMKSRSSTTSCSSTSSRGTGLPRRTVDTEVMRIQDRLVFPSNVPVSIILICLW